MHPVVNIEKMSAGIRTAWRDAPSTAIPLDIGSVVDMSNDPLACSIAAMKKLQASSVRVNQRIVARGMEPHTLQHHALKQSL